MLRPELAPSRDTRTRVVIDGRRHIHVRPDTLEDIAYGSGAQIEFPVAPVDGWATLHAGPVRYAAWITR